MALKVSPEVKVAMDYIDLETWKYYDRLCSAGYIDRDIVSPPLVKFSRATGKKCGVCCEAGSCADNGNSKG